MPSPRRAEHHACFIIHSRLPYQHDINEILALPEGFRYRNRFDQQWIEKGILPDIESQLLGKKVLLVLRDVDQNRLVPVRWGTLVVVRRVGRICYFEYRLAELVNYDSAESIREQQIVEATRLFNENHNWLPGQQGVGLNDPSVFLSKVGWQLKRVDAAELTAWGNVISAVATAPAYSRVEFLKIVELTDAANRPALVVDEVFVVDPGMTYTLRVFQHVPAPGTSPIPPHSIELQTFGDQVTTLRNRQNAIGKYDMLTFYLKIHKLRPGERTAMEIPHTPGAASGDNACVSLYIPIRGRRGLTPQLAFTVFILLTSLALIFKPNLLSYLGVSGKETEQIVRNIATIAFVLTVSGGQRALTSMWPSWPWPVTR